VFLHLHCHSHYSFLRGVAPPEEIVTAAVEQKMPAVALTDTNGLYAAVPFYQAAKAAGVKPIVGVTLDVEWPQKHRETPRSARNDGSRPSVPMVLLARDMEGYGNLCQLVTMRHLGTTELANSKESGEDDGQPLPVHRGVAEGADRDRAGLRHAVLVHTFYEYLASSWSRGPVRRFAQDRGQDPARLWAAADLVLVATAPQLDPSAGVAPRALPANACYTGPVVRVPDPPPGPPTDGIPRVLVSLSTIHYPGQTGVLQAILDALADLPVTGVVTTGPAVDPGQLSAPGNCELHRYVPHNDVLPGVSLVIGHGGHATTMRALAWGRPLLIIPMHPMLDQPMIGQAVSEAGAGETLPTTASPARIREAAVRLLADGPHRAAAWRLGDSIRAADGVATAATRLQELLSPAYQQ